MDRKIRNRKRKIQKKEVTIFLLVTLFFATASIFFYTNSSPETVNHTDKSELLVLIPEDVTIIPTPEVQEEVKEEVKEEMKEEIRGVTNIALFGLDKRGEELSRTDTIMIVSLDGSNKKLKLVSLMRDMYVRIPGKWRDRINAAYAYGGPGLAVDTINKNFDLDIKHYVSIDFRGVHKLISKLGGIDIDIKKGELPYLNECLAEINYLDPKNIEPYITLPGMQHLMGKQALSYIRIRYYGNGDYERTERQRAVAVQLFEKVKNLGVLKFPDLIYSTLPYIETNIPIIDIVSLGANTLKFKNDIEQYRLPVDGTFYDEYIRGMDVLVPDIEENTRMLHEFIYGKETKLPVTN